MAHDTSDCMLAFNATDRRQGLEAVACHEIVDHATVRQRISESRSAC